MGGTETKRKAAEKEIAAWNVESGWQDQATDYKSVCVPCFLVNFARRQKSMLTRTTQEISGPYSIKVCQLFLRFLFRLHFKLPRFGVATESSLDG